MTFTTFSFFLAGCVAVAIPILLHLFMKGRPKREIFPAFSFIRKTQRANRRRLVLKHWVLLALRAMILIFLGLLLARPTLTLFSGGDETSSQRTGDIHHGGDGPVAVAIVLDTSVRTDYRRSNLSRLDEAKGFAKSLLPRLPEGSRVAILDSQGDHDSFQIDLLAAEERIDKLRPGAQRRLPVDSVIEAIRLFENVEMENREIFILTDLTAAGWPSESRERLQRQIDESVKKSKGGPLNFYLADFSVPDAADVALVESSVTSGFGEGKGDVTVNLDLTRYGESVGKEGLLELYLFNPGSPDAEKIMTESFLFSDETQKRIPFHITGLAPGFYQGYFRKTPPDALAVNDRIDFSFDVRSGGRVLTVASDPADAKALFLREALAPVALRETGTAPFELESIPYSKFDEIKLVLSDYRAVLFLDAPPLSEKEWRKVADFVQAGGGAGFFLGRSSVPLEGFESSEAVALLGGKPIRQVRAADGGVFLVPTMPEHPILSGFQLSRTDRDVPWQDLPIFRYWRMEWNKGETPIEILRYSDGSPALIDRSVGQGRVVISTTPFSDAPNDSAAWNFLTIGDHAWVFLVLADGIARTLTGGEDQLNHEPFEVVSLHPNFRKDANSVTMTLPDERTVPIPLDVETKSTVRFAGTGLVGSYRMKSEDGDDLGGFSIHYPPRDFDLTLLTPEMFRDYWKPIPLTVVTNPNEIDFVRSGRGGGRDFFPFAAILFALLFATEVIFSNRFYD